MSSSSQNTQNCTEAFRVQKNPIFLLIHSLVVIFDLFGLIFCLCLIVVVFSIRVFHLNLRCMLYNITAALITRTVLTLFRSISQLIRSATAKNDCDLQFDAYDCAVHSTLNSAPATVILYTFIAIAIERGFAFFVYAKYEKIRFPFLAILLVPATWIECILRIVPIFSFDRAKLSAQSQPYCSSLTNENKTDISYLFDISIPFTIVCAVAFFAIYFGCKLKLKLTVRKRIENLSSRYQLQENLRSARLLVILSLSYVTLLIINTVDYAVIATSGISDLVLFAVLKELSSLFNYPLYASIFPLVLLTQVTPFRRCLLKWLHIDNGQMRPDAVLSASVAATMNPAQTMAVIQKMWETG